MKILFVDDEVKILEGLERSLLMVADEDWDLEFVDSGPRALARLADDAFDVIVTDMRMPGMDGAEVLQRAREIAPSTARLVLSGQMEASSALSAIERAHQILSKPCAAEQLCGILRSAVRFRRLLDGDVFRRAVVSADRLPAAPHIYREIRAELDRGDPAIARVAVIAAKDPALTARLVHVANSPFFGGGRRITGAIEAIQRLGLPVLEALAVAAAFERADGSSRELDVVALQARALRVAELAARLRASEAGMAYLAGVLTGVGHLVVASAMPDEYDTTLVATRASGRRLFVVERERWGTTHAEIGAYLLALWGLPDAIVDAVAHHDGPSIAEVGVAPQLAAAVAVAAALDDGMPPSADDVALLGPDAHALIHAAEAA